jgi:3'(2'), 5'-bisphosphate nucleotidase
MSYKDELKVGITAVQKAIKVCRNVESRVGKISAIEKSDRSPVTLADFGSQTTITQVLKKTFPADSIVGEETSEALRTDPDFGRQVLEILPEEEANTVSDVVATIDLADQKTDFTGRFWTLDPIDGTKGFLRGEQYAVALALVENREVVFGILGCPNFLLSPAPLAEKGCIFYAIKNQGAWMLPLTGDRKQSIFVDTITESNHARFCESFESAHASHDTHLKISAELGITAPPIRIDSQVKYAAIARGDASIYMRIPKGETYREKIWDHAAGSIIVREAGGRVTDFQGHPIDFSVGKLLCNKGGIIATNGLLHQKVLDAITLVFQEIHNLE